MRLNTIIAIFTVPAMSTMLESSQADPRPNPGDVFSNDKLVQFSARGMLGVVSLLIGRGAEVNQTDREGMTALMVASKAGDVKTVELLLKEGADVSLLNFKRESALDMTDSVEIQKILIDEEVKQLIILNGDVNSALRIASRSDRHLIVKELVARGADINAQDHAGLSALMIAAANNCVQVVKFLIEKAANVDLVDINGQSALAITHRTFMETAGPSVPSLRLQEIMELLEPITSVGMQGQHETALILAAFENRLEDVATILGYGTNIDSTDGDWESALFAASREGHVDVVRLLITRGADVCLMNAVHQTAAEVTDSSEIREILADAEVTKLIRTKGDVSSALLVAARADRVQVVEKLIERGANINTQNRAGKSALMIAAGRGCVQVVKYLVSRQANMTLVNRRGQTAKKLAANALMNTNVLSDRHQRYRAIVESLEHRTVVHESTDAEADILVGVDSGARKTRG